MICPSQVIFDLSPYHWVLATLGVSIILAYWIPRFVSGREPASSALLVGAGLILGLLVPSWAGAIDPTNVPQLWERTTELCVIIGLFGTGLRIDRLTGRKLWQPTVRLLLIAMPLTVIALALFGWLTAGMTLAGSLLLGAILSPTDPVLAADVQVGAPLEGGEHPVRFALTTEAGLNDGLAFPFVYLGIAIATAGGISFGLLANWLALDVAYRIAVGVAAGLGLGWMLGKFLSAWPRDNALSETQSGVLGFAGVLAIYGAAELAEGYGFIAVFAAALVLRRKEADHHFHQKLHDFTEALEHALTSILLVALGSVLPVLWTYLDWQHAAIGAALIFLVRPAAGFLALQRSALDQRARIASAFYGVRGIGSLYYLAYAGNHIELVDEGSLWATVAFTIFLSTIAHGLTVGFALNFATRSGSERPRQSR